MVKKPPATSPRDAGLSARLNLPISPEMLEEIDEWRRAQRDIPGRPEAIRRMVAIVLKGRRR